MDSDFPARVYTEEEIKKAIDLIQKGYKHNITIEGTPEFSRRVEEALDHVKAAGYHDFLRTYIRSIIEIDGLTQLHEADAAVWANKYALQSTVDAASIFIQKANHMKEYLEGELYYGGESEKRSVNKRIEFLQALMTKTNGESIRKECDRLLKMWKEGSIVY